MTRARHAFTLGALGPPLVFVSLACAHCSKASGASSAKPADGPEPAVQAPRAGDDAEADPMSEAERAAWGEADGGEPSELLRLADLVGCSGLQERAADPSLRGVAVKAMRHCPDFSELPWLADLATSGPDDLAADALDTIVDQAARPRRAVDPEDADELHAGCATLLALARATDRPRSRRVGAVRALRMLSERGCVQRADIPTDVDVK